jgi:hypothetical protein
VRPPSRLFVSAAFAVGALSLLATAGGASGAGLGGGIALTGISAVKGLHARRLPPLQVPAPPPEGDDGPDKGQVSVAGGAKPLMPTPLLGVQPRSLQAAADAPIVGGKLAGLGSNVVEPSDTQIGVGPSDVVEMVNTNVEFWSKGGAAEGTDTLGSFFTDSANDRRLDQMSDPRVLYDSSSARWFATVVDVTRNEVVMVVSPTAQPGSSAWIYSFPFAGCPDQPRLGVSDALVAFGVDLFSDCGSFGHRIGGLVKVISKAELLTGAAPVTETYGPSPLYGAITPVVSLSSTPTLWFASSNFVYGSIDLFAADKVEASSLALRRVLVWPLSPVPDALQSDSSLINTGDDRIQTAVWENNELYVSVSDGCVVNGEAGVHACARYVGIDTTNEFAPVVTMDAGVALDQNRDIFYPTIMPSSDGIIYSVFGYSSAEETPGIGILTQPAEISTWTTLTTGTGANESGRWGDYFGTARDPADPTHVWVAAAYGTGGGGWSTTVAPLGSTPFQLTPPPTVPPPPVARDCRVPTVTGLGLAVATTKLRIHHCARGTVKRHYSTRRAGVVLSQDPEAGSDLANGTAVNLVESRGRRHKHG